MRRKTPLNDDIVGVEIVHDLILSGCALGDAQPLLLPNQKRYRAIIRSTVCCHNTTRHIIRLANRPAAQPCRYGRRRVTVTINGQTDVGSHGC